MVGDQSLLMWLIADRGEVADLPASAAVAETQRRTVRLKPKWQLVAILWLVSEVEQVAAGQRPEMRAVDRQLRGA